MKLFFISSNVKSVALKRVYITPGLLSVRSKLVTITESISKRSACRNRSSVLVRELVFMKTSVMKAVRTNVSSWNHGCLVTVTYQNYCLNFSSWDQNYAWSNLRTD